MLYLPTRSRENPLDAKVSLVKIKQDKSKSNSVKLTSVSVDVAEDSITTTHETTVKVHDIFSSSIDVDSDDQLHVLILDPEKRYGESIRNRPDVIHTSAGVAYRLLGALKATIVRDESISTQSSPVSEFGEVFGSASVRVRSLKIRFYTPFYMLIRLYFLLIGTTSATIFNRMKWLTSSQTVLKNYLQNSTIYQEPLTYDRNFTEEFLGLVCLASKYYFKKKKDVTQKTFAERVVPYLAWSFDVVMCRDSSNGAIHDIMSNHQALCLKELVAWVTTERKEIIPALRLLSIELRTKYPPEKLGSFFRLRLFNFDVYEFMLMVYKEVRGNSYLEVFRKTDLSIYDLDNGQMVLFEIPDYSSRLYENMQSRDIHEAEEYCERMFDAASQDYLLDVEM
ncbi:MAG: hypothetical protein JSS82_15825 [Bacteroidetes bacterium]|nr:hypothetical protein [Bacteroidota bacterium]